MRLFDKQSSRFSKRLPLQLLTIQCFLHFLSFENWICTTCISSFFIIFSLNFLTPCKPSLDPDPQPFAICWSLFSSENLLTPFLNSSFFYHLNPFLGKSQQAKLSQIILSLEEEIVERFRQYSRKQSDHLCFAKNLKIRKTENWNFVCKFCGSR